MNLLLRLSIAALCFLAAIGCYFFGAPRGGLIFLLLGGGFELIFWIMLARKRNKKLP